MCGNWSTSTLGETCYITDGAHAKVERQSEGILYLTSKNIGEGNLKLDKVDCISEPDYLRLFKDTRKSQRRLRDGDVLTGIIGTFGNAYRYKSSDRFGISSSVAILRPDQNILDPDFLYYVITSSNFKATVEAYKGGSVQGYTNIATLKTLPIPLPDLSAQSAIAHILRTLDDKIELNRQINTTLESMAQALFKSWFVDFDPVIDNALAAGNDIPEPLQAKADKRAGQHVWTSDEDARRASATEGASQKRKALGDKRKPLPDGLHQQFPDRFVFTEEMGWVPEGWTAVKFSELVKAKQGRYTPKDTMVEVQDDTHRYPVWGGNGILGYSTAMTYESPVVLMTCRGSNCGLIKMTSSPSWVSNNSFACIPNIGSTYFLYLYFLHESFSESISGSAQPQITYTALKNKLMKFPVSGRICDEFSNQVQQLRDKQVVNDLQNESLVKLRDTLLPKLLSGELRIPEAEKQIAEAV